MLKVLFVCAGNTCRSVLSEGLFREMVRTARLDEEVEIDSAGTHVKMEFLPPTSKAIRVASEKDINVEMIRTRSVKEADLVYFDYILAMEKNNLLALEAIQSQKTGKRPCLLLDFAFSVSDREIIDPYDRGIRAYREAMGLIDLGCRGLLAAIKEQ